MKSKILNSNDSLEKNGALVFTVSETAAMLKISTKSVYRLVQRNKLAVCKELRHLRVPRASIERLLAM
jgi:excisionase family DNA binding protein